MQLYTFFRSSTSFRLRIALAYKGIAYEPKFVSLPKLEHRAPVYLAKNPQGLVPALVDDAGRVFTQSMAMIEYLDDIHPEPPLMPKGRGGKMVCARGIADHRLRDASPQQRARAQIPEGLRPR